LVILVGVGKENGLGPFLVADFIFGYLMGAVFKGLVVDISAINALGTVKNSLFMVDELGL
jgi:hypothetical protein